MKTFNQLLAEQPHVHPVIKTFDMLEHIASLKRSAQALEDLIIVKQTVLDEARAALNDLRETIRKLENEKITV